MFLMDFVRQRPNRVPDPYNPAATVASWDSPAEERVSGFFDNPDSVEQPGAVRSQEVSAVTLYVPDTSADVQRGDRLRQGERTWTVMGFPDIPKNPFTGYAPWLVITLQEVTG